MRVIIVGAGIAGLSAAYILNKNGVDVKILEKETEPGGRCKSIQWQGGWIDLGAEMMWPVDTGIYEMAQDMDLVPRLKRDTDHPDCVGGLMGFACWRDGIPHSFSLKNKFSLLTSGLLRSSEILRLAGVVPTLFRHFLRTKGISSDAYEIWRTNWADDISVEAWLSRMNPRLLDAVIEPFVDLFWGYRPEELSRAALLQMLETISTDMSPMTTDEGFGLLPRTLAQKLGVQTGARVTRVEAGKSPVAVEWETGDGGKERDEADAVILALHGNLVNKVVKGLDAEKMKFFQGVKYHPKEMIYLKLSKKFDYSLAWNLFPIEEGRNLSSMSYGPSKITPDVDYVRLNMKTDFVRRHAKENIEDFMDAIQKEFIRHYPEMGAAIEDRFVARWDPGIPEFYPGYIRSLDRFRRMPPTEGVEFAGDYLNFSVTGGAFRSGYNAAMKCLRDMPSRSSRS